MPRLLPLVALLIASAPVLAQEPIRFARTPDISPDGKLVAFSYLGDIHIVEAIGGVARAVTSHPAHDINPVFSPDGRHLAFSSNRHGGYDVYVVPTRGGRPRRITFDAASDMACGWSADGKRVLFASSRGIAFPSGYDLYSVPAIGGRAERITVAGGKEGSWSPRGDLLAYTRGPGSWYRKHYRGSSNDDLWICKADGTSNRRLTTFDGQDHSPMWSADGSSLFYVSEHFGNANIVRRPLAGDARPVRHTDHKDETVRRARISRDGHWMVYECGADLWVVSSKEGSKPRKLAIEVNADDKANIERVVNLTRGITQFAMAPGEKQVIVAIRGKLFRMKVGSNPGKPTQLTTGPSMDHGAAWSPDASKVVFISDRDGQEDLYLLEANDPDHPKLADAQRFKTTRLTNSRDAESGVTFSPDGKWISFLRSGKLWVMSPSGKDPKPVVDAVSVFDYEWSPDSKWFVFARRDGSFASELYMVPATGPTAKDPVRNITKYSTFNAGVTWSADGKKLAFLSDRRASATLHILDLEKPGVSGKPASVISRIGSAWDSKKPIIIDWEDIHKRARAISAGNAEEAAISPDGSKVAYRDSTTRDLWVTTTSGGSTTRLTTGGLQPRQITWSRRKGLIGGTSSLLYFTDASGNLRLCSATGGEAKPGVDKAPALPFKLRMTIRTDELHQEMFDQGWRFLADSFYDKSYHGHDWDEVRRRYRPLVKNVVMKEDLYALMYLMMGELNASHLGVSGFVSAPEEETAELGLLFDESHKGKGFKVSEILKRGPADRKGLALKPGDYIVNIDDTELDEKANLSQLLNGKVGDSVFLQVTDDPNNPKAKRRRVELRAISRYGKGRDKPGATDLMYDRWVARNTARVEALSKGRLGYIHIPSMDAAGLDSFVRSLYSDNFDKDAIVLDVRFNGGGFTHDQVLNYLGSKEHTRFVNRDGGQGLVLRASDRKWHKPLVLLINNRSYSDAEIFPSAFRAQGLGKLVGQPTGGLVIGTGGVRLIDGSTFRIPRIGVYSLAGNVNMDKKGVMPDVVVEPQPDDLARGIDAQLAKAVEVVQADVLTWRKKRNLGTGTVPVAGSNPTTGAVTSPKK